MTCDRGNKLIAKTSYINSKTLSHTWDTQSSIKTRDIKSLLYPESEGYYLMLVSASCIFASHELGFVT